jgi:hypothetical protein
MSEPKFTTWEWDSAHFVVRRNDRMPSGVGNAVVIAEIPWMASPRRDATGRLIAASPDLRAVVEEALATGEHAVGCQATCYGVATVEDIDESRCTCWRQRAKARW